MNPGPAAATPSETIRPSDYLDVDRLLSDTERDIRDSVRAFVRDRVTPNVGEWFEQAAIPLELASELGKLGVLGMHLEGYGLPGAMKPGPPCVRVSSRVKTSDENRIRHWPVDAA